MVAEKMLNTIEN